MTADVTMKLADVETTCAEGEEVTYFVNLGEASEFTTFDSNIISLIAIWEKTVSAKAGSRTVEYYV